MPETPRLGLPLIEAAQSQKHIPLNESLARLDALIHLAAASRAENAPPASPSEGERWIVGPAPTGDWSGHAGEIAILQNGGWAFAAPIEGMIIRISDEAAAFLHDGSGWTPLASGGGSTQNVEFGGLGLGGSTPDATNRLSVSSPAVLFNHAGAGVQAKLNKSAAAETASLLFQTNWSGRAEMGLNGSDDWSLKVSADGAAWTEAIKVSAATGALTLAQDLGVAQGGTGASTAEAARANLGAAAGILRQGVAALTAPASDGWTTPMPGFAIVPLSPSLPSADYAVHLDAAAATSRAALGALEVYDKTANGFKIRASGSSGASLRWTLHHI